MTDLKNTYSNNRGALVSFSVSNKKALEKGYSGVKKRVKYNNYAYDAEGRLIKDNQEQIASIEWTTTGEVKAINRTNGSSKKNLKVDNDVNGYRVEKHILSSSNVLEKSVYYILDATGQVISTYERVIEVATVK